MSTDESVFRPTARYGPCHDGLPGWHGRHGYAYEGGSRASWLDGGYSAEKSACSLVTPKASGCAPVLGLTAPGSARRRGTVTAVLVDASEHADGHDSGHKRLLHPRQRAGGGQISDGWPRAPVPPAQERGGRGGTGSNGGRVLDRAPGDPVPLCSSHPTHSCARIFITSCGKPARPEPRNHADRGSNYTSVVPGAPGKRL